MKIKLVLLLLCIIYLQAYPQNITNRLGSNGVFKIKDGASDFLTLSQSSGQMNILKSLRLENTSNSTTGVIFKGADRFIHNYGTDNTFIGINSGNFTMTGNGYNTALGYQSLNSNTTGSNNSANGKEALYSNTTGNNNTANGYLALYSNTTGNYNTASGSQALVYNNGDYNTAFGTQSLYFNTTGFENTAVGLNSLYNNTVGEYNTATGSQSLFSNTSGKNNTANGKNSLQSNTTGDENTAVGMNSLYSNTSGVYNTAFGYRALFSNTSGNANTAFGNHALEPIATGQGNTCIGFAATPDVTTDNYTGIGYNVGTASSTSNSVEIGNSSVSWIGGQVGWSTYSDERIKDNITENVPGLAFINKLRPVTYNLNIHKQNEMIYKDKKNQEDWDSKYDIEKIRMTGFIAQEVEKAANEVNYNFSGVVKSKDENGIYSLRYSEFVVPLVKAVQEQQKIIEALTKRIEQLEKK